MKGGDEMRDILNFSTSFSGIQYCTILLKKNNFSALFSILRSNFLPQVDNPVENMNNSEYWIGDNFEQWNNRWSGQLFSIDVQKIGGST